MTHSPHARPRFTERARPKPDASVLVLFCHPAPHRSRVNRALVRAIADLPHVTVHDLYEAYPDHVIDVAWEQGLLLAHDIIVMQHPFYWYSTPALLKDWQDHVLEFGWAYGTDGNALRGKRLLNAVTTGGPAAAYRPDGHHGATMKELLMPISRTARLCGMTWLEPHVVHGTHRMTDDDIAAAAAAYRAAILALGGAS